MTKADLRREMRGCLQMLGAARVAKSAAITAAIAAQPAFVRGTRIALFSALPGEPDVQGLWEEGPRNFCYPRVVASRIEFVEVTAPGDLVPAAWNPRIREPAPHKVRIIGPAEIELILVPGLAFTRDGRRLGRGGGFYDRFLAELPDSAVLLGVCFDCQIVQAIPVEPHDQRVDAIITESGLIQPSQ